MRAWAVSLVLIRKSLEGFDCPLIGLAVSVVAHALCPGPARHRRAPLQGPVRTLVGAPRPGLRRALDLAALGGARRGDVRGHSGVETPLDPVGLLLSAIVVGRRVEHMAGLVWRGSALIAAGSPLLVARTL